MSAGPGVAVINFNRAWDGLTLSVERPHETLARLESPADLVRLALRFRERNPGEGVDPKFEEAQHAVIQQLTELSINPASDNSELIISALQAAEFEGGRHIKNGLSSLLGNKLSVPHTHPNTLRTLAAAGLNSDAEARLVNRILSGIHDEQAIPIICELTHRKSPHTKTIEEVIYRRNLPSELLYVDGPGSLPPERAQELKALVSAFLPHLRKRSEKAEQPHEAEVAKGSDIREFLLRNLTQGGPRSLLAQQIFLSVAEGVHRGDTKFSGLLTLLAEAEARESAGSSPVWRKALLDVVGECVRKGRGVSTELVRALLREPLTPDIDTLLVGLAESPGSAALPATLLLQGYLSSSARSAVSNGDIRTRLDLHPFVSAMEAQGAIRGDVAGFQQRLSTVEISKGQIFESLSGKLGGLDLSKLEVREDFDSVVDELAKLSPLPLLLGIARQLEAQKSTGGAWIEPPSQDPYRGSEAGGPLWELPFSVATIFRAIPRESDDQMALAEEIVTRLFPPQSDYRRAPTPIEQLREYISLPV